MEKDGNGKEPKSFQRLKTEIKSQFINLNSAYLEYCHHCNRKSVEISTRFSFGEIPPINFSVSHGKKDF